MDSVNNLEAAKSETIGTSIRKVAFRAGLLISLALIGYFLLMKVFGLLHIAELRGFNFIIVLVGLFITIRKFKQQSGSKLEYLQGIALGCWTCTVAAVVFAFFVFVYFAYIDPAQLNYMRESAPVMGKFLTPFFAGVTILAEAAVSGLVISFALMQYYKDDSIHE